MHNISILIAVIALSVCGVLWAVLLKSLQRERSIKTALEINQKRLDHQTARISILTRSLPSLQTLVLTPTASEDWKMLCLDEARALVRADAAGYWRYLEREQKLELDVARGSDALDIGESIQVGMNTGLMGDAIKKRLTILDSDLTSNNEKRSILVSPLVVSGELRGVFRFIRKGEESLTQRDADLITMFVKQVSLTLENKDMTSNREKFYLELIQALADTLDARDASTEGQTRRARNIARGIAKEMDLPDTFTYYLEFAALMHDIGNLAIDEQLLKKPGKLTPQEFEIVKKHPEYGHKILSTVSLLAPVAPMVLYHQERYDGTGYPAGLTGEEIPLGARIVAVLDAWGAMTSARSWRKAFKKEDAIKEIKKGSGTQFDPKVVEAFLATIESHQVQT